VVTQNDAWIINNGASGHKTSHNNWYTSLRPTRDELKVSIENGPKCLVKGWVQSPSKQRKGQWGS